MLCIGSIESKVQISHEEVHVCHGIRFNHFPLAEQSNVFQNALGHRQSLINGILTRLEMAIHEAKDCVIESQLNHYTTLPTVAKHILHNVILADIAQESTVVFLHEYDKKDLSLPHKVYLNILLAKIAMYQTNFFFFLTSTFLTTKCNDIVAFMVGE